MVWGINKDCVWEDCNSFSGHHDLIFPKDVNSSTQYTDYTVCPSRNLIIFFTIIHR